MKNKKIILIILLIILILITINTITKKFGWEDCKYLKLRDVSEEEKDELYENDIYITAIKQTESYIEFVLSKLINNDSDVFNYIDKESYDQVLAQNEDNGLTNDNIGFSGYYNLVTEANSNEYIYEIGIYKKSGELQIYLEVEYLKVTVLDFYSFNAVFLSKEIPEIEES